MSYEAMLAQRYREARKRLRYGEALIKPPPPPVLVTELPELPPTAAPPAKQLEAAPMPKPQGMTVRAQLQWAIFEAVRLETGHGREAIASASRVAVLVHARKLFCLLMVRLKASDSKLSISRLVGHRDHTSVLYLIRSAEKLYDSQPHYAELVHRLERRVKEIMAQ